VTSLNFWEIIDNRPISVARTAQERASHAGFATHFISISGGLRSTASKNCGLSGITQLQAYVCRSG